MLGKARRTKQKQAFSLMSSNSYIVGGNAYLMRRCACHLLYKALGLLQRFNFKSRIWTDICELAAFILYWLGGSFRIGLDLSEMNFLSLEKVFLHFVFPFFVLIILHVLTVLIVLFRRLLYNFKVTMYLLKKYGLIRELISCHRHIFSTPLIAWELLMMVFIMHMS
jgi:hypothetical protein